MHPDEVELQALIDGELDPKTSERVLSHLAGCERCSARHDMLERAFRETAALLSELDREAPGISARDVIREAERRALPRMSAKRRTLWAASIAALLVAGAVAAAIVPWSPVRMVMERMLTGAGTEAPTRGPAPADEWGQHAGIALVPGDGLEIAFETIQSEGSIELVEVGADTARVEVRSDSVGFVVGDGSVVIENRGARASYRIFLPEDLPAVLIRVGDRTVYQRDGSELLRDESRPEGSSRRIGFRPTRPDE